MLSVLNCEPGSRHAGLVESGDVSIGGTASKAGAAPSFEIIASTSGLPAAGFDAAVSSLVLCSVDDVRESACELYRWLKPGGVLLFLEHVADGQQQRAAHLLSRHGQGPAFELPVWHAPAGQRTARRAGGERVAECMITRQLQREACVVMCVTAHR